MYELSVLKFTERFLEFGEERSTCHRRNNGRWQAPAQLFGDLKAHSLGTFAVVAAQVHVHHAPAKPIGELRAQTIDVVVVSLHAHKVRIVNGGRENLFAFKIFRHKNPRIEPRERRVRSDSVGEVPRASTPNGTQAERVSGVDRRRNDTVLERECGLTHRVVLDPYTRYAEFGGEARDFHQRREAGVPGVHRFTFEGQPLTIPPEVGGATLDGLAIRQHAMRGVQRLERSEALLANRDGSGFEFRAAQAATLRKNAERGWSGGCGHLFAR